MLRWNIQNKYISFNNVGRVVLKLFYTVTGGMFSEQSFAWNLISLNCLSEEESVFLITTCFFNKCDLLDITTRAKRASLSQQVTTRHQQTDVHKSKTRQK